MALAITSKQEQLVDSVSRFAARHAPIDKTRAAFDSTVAGESPLWWQEFTARGFHAVHLPEHAGGQGGTLADIACVIEAAAALLPGPLLSTATASAVTSLADASAAPLIADLAAVATAVVVLPEHSDVHAVADGDSWRLSGSSGPTLGICGAQHILLAAHTENGGELWLVLDPRGSPGPDLTVQQLRGGGRLGCGARRRRIRRAAPAGGSIGRPDGGGSRPRPSARRATDVRRNRLHVGTRHTPILAPRHQPGRVAGADDAQWGSWPAR
jgi:alkylation response protein AidB-like acyl-CoA dehydrogenase